MLSKLGADVGIDTTGNIAAANVGSNGLIEAKDTQGNVVLKMNGAVSGVSAAGTGNIVGGASEQYGILVDSTSLTTTTVA